ncbi:MAG: T9SS type A sorting domain-containing protein [Bacteroidia bacterium]|nr:T9SS type A sorting domain-containing protein [Bacteroidia bacterium]
MSLLHTFTKSLFWLRLVCLFMFTGVSLSSFAEANYVYHEATTNNPGCGANNYRSVVAPSSAQSLTLAWKVEYQFYTTSTWVYYTTDGSNPSGANGTGTGTTQVLTGSYSCTFGSPVVDVATATIPAQPAGTVVKYIISAVHSGGGAEIWANGPGAPCSCGPVTNNASLATVFSYTVTPSANVVEVYATGGTAYGSFATLNAAFTAINAGTHTGAIRISINANTTEPAISVPLLKSTSPSSYSSILIRPAGNRTINSAASPMASRGVIELYGADNVTIDGDDPNTAGTRNLTIQVVTSASVTAAIRLASTSTTGLDGADNNTVKNCIIIGSRNSATSTTNSYGINMSNSSAIGTGAYSSLNTRIENNVITRCYNAIFANGASATYPNTGTIIKGNTLGSSISAENIGQRGIVITYSAVTPGVGSAIIEENDIRGGDYGTTGYASTVAGIEVGTVNAGCIIRKNNIHDINQPFASGYGTHGIYITGATSNSGITMVNNFIRDCKMVIYQASFTSTFIPCGVFFTAGATNVVFNHNTILMNDQLAVNATYTSFCVNSSVSGVTFSQFLNNILVNNHASAGAYGFAVNNTASISSANVNNNAYYVNPSANVGHYNGSARTTLANWQAATAKDGASVNVNPAFVSATDLHINIGTPTLLESGGTLTAVSTDYDGNTRNCPPDIGADEFAGTNPNGPSVPMGYTSSTTTQASGSACLGGSVNKAIIRMEIVTDANTGCPATLNNLIVNGLGTTTYSEVTSGKIYFTGTSSVFSTTTLVGTFTVNGSNQTVTPGSSITLLNGTNYFWVAYDISASATGPNFDAQWVSASINVNLTPQSITPTVSSPAGAISFSPAMTGTYTVGAGGTYTTLTAAVNDLTCRGVSGPVTLSLINDGTTPYNSANGEVFPIVVTNPSGISAVNTVTIKPAASVNPIISGSSATAILAFSDADYFMIDGSNTPSGTTRNLSIVNTSVATNTAAIWLSSNAAAGVNQGCQNNIFKNTNLACGADQSLSTNLTYGILASGNAISGTTGLGNNSNTIQNDSIVGVRYGVFLNGDVTTLNNGNVVTQCKIGAAGFGPASGQIGQGGIVVQGQSAGYITNNEIKYVGITFGETATGADRVGIGVGAAGWSPTATAVNNFTVTGNTIHHIKEEKTFSAVGIIVAGTGTPSNNLIANNIIYDVLANGTAGDQSVGIGIGAGDGDKIVYNTILMTGDLDPGASTSATQSAAGIRIATATPTNLTVKNNLISIDVSSNTNTLNHYAIVAPSISYAFGTGGLDYNDYYINTSNTQMKTGGTGTSIPYTPVTTLASWKATLTPNQDAASIAENPVFVSATDLHLQMTNGANCLIKGKGTPVAGVTTDIDGNTRNASKPGIGADEYGGDLPTTPTTTDPTDVCQGVAVTITGTGSTGATTYGFYDAATGNTQTTTLANGAIVSPSYTTNLSLAAGTYLVYAEGVDAGGCVSPTRKEVTITINALPTVTWTGALADQCITATTLTLTGTGESPTGGAFSGSGVTGANFDASAAGTGSKTLTYTYTDANGCMNSATNTVMVNALPVVTWTGALADQCITATTLTLTGTGESPTGGAFSGSGVTGANFDASVAGAGSQTLTYTFTDANGCTNTAINSVVVNALPVVTWTGALPAQCITATTLALTGTGESPTGGAFSGSGVTGANFDASVAGTGSQTLTYTFTDANGCTNTATNSVMVNALPVVTASANTPLCVNSILTLTSTSNQSGTFQWSGPNGYSSPMQNPAGITGATASLNGTYTVNFTSSIPGCNGSANINVFVGPIQLSVTADPADSTLAHAVISNCAPNYTLYWRKVASGSSWSNLSTAANNPDITGLAPATAYVAYAVDANGATTDLVYFTTSGIPFCGNAPTLTASVSCDKIFTDWSTGLLYSQYSVSFRKVSPTLSNISSTYTSTTSKVYTITPANFGSTYEVSVKGMCDNQYSIAASPVYVTVPDPRPIAPSGLSFSATCSSITTTWNASPGATGYFVRIKNPLTGSTLVNFYTVGTTYTRTGLPSNFTYEIWVIPVGCSNLQGTPSLHYFVQTCSGTVTPTGIRAQSPDMEELYADPSQSFETDMNVNLQATVYPNPNNGTFTVSVVNIPEPRLQIEVVNLVGQTVYSQSVNTENGMLHHEVELEKELPQGTYLVRVTTESGSYITKFVKM